MKGAVIGIDITNAGDIRDGGLMNRPDQICGPFIITVLARYDDPQGGFWQTVFDFGNVAEQDNIWLGQSGNSNDMAFEVWHKGVVYRVVATGAIVTGQLATWRVGIDADGLMWMEKDGKRIAEQPGMLPAVVQRNSNLLGISNWSGDSPLDGVVLGLTVVTDMSKPFLMVPID
jgi:hypothetical protein